MEMSLDLNWKQNSIQTTGNSLRLRKWNELKFEESFKWAERKESILRVKIRKEKEAREGADSED